MNEQLTTETFTLPSQYVNDPYGWRVILDIKSDELVLDIPEKYYFDYYIDGINMGYLTASVQDGYSLQFEGTYQYKCKTIELAWNKLTTNILTIQYNNYIEYSRTFNCSVWASYTVTSPLKLTVENVESADTIYDWGTMQKGTRIVNNKQAALSSSSLKCLPLKISPTVDSTFVYVYNQYANFVCFHIDDCPAYGEELGHTTWREVAQHWTGIRGDTTFPSLTMTTEDGDEKALLVCFSTDEKTLMYMWPPESKISTKRIETLKWVDNAKYAGFELFYVPEYSTTELGKEIVEKGVFFSLDIDHQTMERAKWRGPID